jgi:hypothetical protein
MSTVDRGADPRVRTWWPVIALAAYGAMMVAMAFTFSSQINPDGVAYLRIAGYYLSGDLGKAVSGYWSPLYSWLLMPWLALGVSGLLATKLLGVLLALSWVIGMTLLGRHYLESGITRRLFVVAAAVSVLNWSMEIITPDLLLTVLLTYYFYLVRDPATVERPSRAFACGVLGGLAYLAKAYAFPFFIAHFLLTIALHAWAGAKPRPLKPYVVVTLAGVLGFLLVAAPWVGVLTMKYGRPTITTAAGRRNIPAAVVFGATNPDRAPFQPGLKLAPIEAGRITAWETPDEVHLPPFNATATPSPATVRPGRFQVILSNLIVIRDELSEFDYFRLALSALLATGFIGFLHGPASAVGIRYLWGFFTVSLYALGYLPLWAREARYFWPVAGLLMVLSFGLAEQLAKALTHQIENVDGRRVRKGPWMVLAALIVAFSYVQVGSHWLLDRFRTAGPDFVTLAAQLEGERGRLGVSLRGPIAGNDWPSTVYLAYLMNQPSYGATTVEDPTLLAAELSRLGIRTYYVFNNERQAERLKQSPRFRARAELPMTAQVKSAGNLVAFEVFEGEGNR